MTLRFTLALAGLLFLLPNTVSLAHHAFSPVYDGTRTVTIKGILTEFKLVNPHATMTLDVTNEAGKHETWTVEMAGLLSLSRQGWTEDSVSLGEQLTVTGNPTHTGSPRIAFRRLVLPNGQELLDPNDNRQDDIEEQRRERARQRTQ
jgi:hypothetical protein